MSHASISSDRTLADRVWNSGGTTSSAPIASNNDTMGQGKNFQQKGVDMQRHRKMMAQILTYVADMHRSLGNSSGNGEDTNGKGGPSFVRRVQNGNNVSSCWQSFFYQEPRFTAGDGDDRLGILFSTQNFRNLQAIEAETSKALFAKQPFNFYAASTTLTAATANRKRNWSDSFRSPLSSPFPNSGAAGSGGGSHHDYGKSCWFRLTRLTSAEIPEPPTMSNAAVRRYLTKWRDNDPALRDIENLRDILTLETMAHPPEITELSRAQEIRVFIKQYRRYLRKKAYQKAIEPMYIKLFEWVQQTHHNDELVWGLGHARMTCGDKVVNGPLLEILMEVELARDGALLVRPREHTGVAVNREVSALLASNGECLAQLHQAVSELEPMQISPGEPKTYIPFFKKCAVELSSGGSFHLSSKSPKVSADGKMVISEAWCLYARSKPGSVWARDAMKFAKQLNVPSSVSGGGLELPRATLALTHGPSALSITSDTTKVDIVESKISALGFIAKIWKSGLFLAPAHPAVDEATLNARKKDPIVFPLPASEVQNRIAEMILHENYPAVVTEGPPGTGKTHTIANVICASLCHGKRVLITSKGAAALSVIRDRLPQCVQDLCVDVSLSESQGMRQLQQTVERLANRVACISTETEAQKCDILSKNIAALEQERCEIDRKLVAASDSKRRLIEQPDGQKLVTGCLDLIEKKPWLMTASWPVEKLTILRDELKYLVSQQNSELSRVALGFEGALPSGIVSEISVKAELPLASVKLATKNMLSFMPLLGSAFSGRNPSLDQLINTITIDGKSPASAEEWRSVLHVLKFEESIAKFHRSRGESLMRHDGCPDDDIYDRVGQNQQQRIIKTSLLEDVEQALNLKQLALELDIEDELESACACYALDTRRSQIASQIQSLAEDLVDARVVTQLSKTFSAEAQSALIRFSQIAGRAKFSRSALPSNMSARQRRHRKEYLESFDQCVRYIPCWIMTTAQISDYLPAECLFDLAIIDESSQSDITVLPGMLRGKQWLIVGDSKQVSPTEAFVSEDKVEHLRAALPQSPLQNSLMPGQSFFDFAAQAYPRGRVVLREHFRCAPEIINFSNRIYYHGQLVPLRLPTSNERLTPSLIDVRVPNGVKTGKTNEQEIEIIVQMIDDFVNDLTTKSASMAKSIGVISLMGDEQSKTIRERLLTKIGNAKMYEHNILVGDPPTFQGNERDIIFLSMVCSPRQVPTQNNMMYAQRMNVALSRARDRMVLVRSIESSDIPNTEDVRHSIIEFFEEATAANAKTESEGDNSLAEPKANNGCRKDTATFSFRGRTEALLESFLKERGFTVRRMGVVWNQALCVEHAGSTARAALCIENTGETQEEWNRVVTQQKSIERVGWKCLRVDGLSLLIDHRAQFEKIIDFLEAAGVEAPVILYDSLDEDDGAAGSLSESQGAKYGKKGREHLANPMGITEIIAVSSDEENDDDRKMPAVYPDVVLSHDVNALENDQMDASQFGQVVNVDFCGGNMEDDSTLTSSSAHESSSVRSAPSKTSRKKGRNSHQATTSLPTKTRNNNDDDDVTMSDQSDTVPTKVDKKRRIEDSTENGALEGATNDSEKEGSATSSPSKRRRKLRLKKYSRDGRYYPNLRELKTDEENENAANDWYDTDSDLPNGPDSRGPEDKDDDDEEEDYEPEKQS